jgi:replicative DNA helicase
MIAGGYWNGQLVTISGTAGTGKTSLLLQELSQMAEDANPAYLLCLEMPDTMMARKLIQHRFHIDIAKQTLKDVQYYRKKLEHMPLILGSSIGDLDDIEKTVERTVKRFDVKCVAFDNLNYFVRSVINVPAEIARVTKRLKEIAIRLNISILLISQPRKFNDDERMMTMQDLKDSAAIAADSDVIILLHRKRIQTKASEIGTNSGFHGGYSPMTTLRVDKARYSVGGEMLLHFDGAISTFREYSDEELEEIRSNNATETENPARSRKRSRKDNAGEAEG